jgi:hypothetical protein
MTFAGELRYLIMQKTQVSWESSEHWIPTFAGMTVGRDNLSYPRRQVSNIYNSTWSLFYKKRLSVAPP